MEVVVVQAPVWPLLALGPAKEHLGILHDDDDQIITDILEALSELLDGPTGDMAHAFGVQELEAVLPGFPCGLVELPYPPLREVVSIIFKDLSGTDQSLDAEAFEITSLAGYAQLFPTPNTAWPATQCRPDAVRIRFLAGYDALPRRAAQATKLMLGDLYAARETFGPSSLSKIELSVGAERLLSSFRDPIIR
jgi:uncharacterized phiE125 gp8 family phage protein